MPTRSGADTPLVKEYVRCRDMDGELWTIPRGSKLHLLVWADAEQGYADHFLPVELIREPWRGLEWDDGNQLASGLRSLDFLTQAQKHRLWRQGQFARLQHRTKVRRNG